MVNRVPAKKRTSPSSKKKEPLFKVYPPIVLALPPEVEFIFEILREGFKEHRDQKSLKGLEALIKRIHELSLETQLSSRCVERTVKENQFRRKTEQQKLQDDQVRVLEGLCDPARMAERAVQAMLWTDLQRALEPTPGVPDSERFVVLNEEGTPKRLFPKGSDEMRRLAKKAYTLKHQLQTYFEASSWYERARFYQTLSQTSPPATLVLDGRGKKKPRKMPQTLRGRRAEFKSVKETLDYLHAEIPWFNYKDLLILEELKKTFPELSEVTCLENLPSFKTRSPLAHCILGKRWGVTPSTVQTRLKR